MKLIESLAKLKAEGRTVKSGVSGDTIFTAKAVLFLATQMDKLLEVEGELVQEVKKLQRLPRKRRKPTPYNLFFGEQMKLGTPIKEIPILWKRYKGK